MENLMKKIERLEYHHKLMMKMLHVEGYEFEQLIIRKNLDEVEVDEFMSMCERMNKELEEQKAEKFVFHAPLFNDFLLNLNPKLGPVEVVDACLKQNIYPELMAIFKKNF